MSVYRLYFTEVQFVLKTTQSLQRSLLFLFQFLAELLDYLHNVYRPLLKKKTCSEEEDSMTVE